MTEYIISRPRLPDSSEELGNSAWFNMWITARRQYRELTVGDILYWYSVADKRIAYKSEVEKVVPFPYGEKHEVAMRLQREFGRDSSYYAADPYYVRAPDRGFCLAYKVGSVQRMNLAKPDDLRFPQQGWLLAKHPRAQDWLRG